MNGRIFSSLSITPNEGILWTLFFLAFIGFIVSVFVYIYHWRTYAHNQYLIKKIQNIYIGVGILLLVISFILILLVR